MHSGKTHVASSLRCYYCQARSASTAAAVKPLNHGAASHSVQPVNLTPNLDKWRSVPETKGASKNAMAAGSWSMSERQDSQRDFPKRYYTMQDRNVPQPQLRRNGSRYQQQKNQGVADRMSKWTPSFPSTSNSAHKESHSPNLAHSNLVLSSNNGSKRAGSSRDAYRGTSGVKNSVDLSTPTGSYETSDTHGHNRPNKERHKSRGSTSSGSEKDRSTRTPVNAKNVRDPPAHISKEKKVKQKPSKRPPVDVFIPNMLSVGSLARLLNVKLEKLQRCMRRAGMNDQDSYDYILSAENASLLAMEFNRNPIVDDEAAFDIYPLPLQTNQSSPRRPPIVTIMGHVDHGKTTLLDALRSTSVAKGEAGGITQHIGAFSVPIPSSDGANDGPSNITFLDTPGHAAFSAMRARGAMVTDIIVLVVAADDGVMPQTREVIELIKKEKGNVGVIVALNKIDKPGIDVSKVHNALWAEGIQLEVMGGDIPSVEVSGLTGQGLPTLIENISLLAEVNDYRADTEGPVHGHVIESKMMKGIGNTATVLIQRGSLTPASHLICGTTSAKVRHLTDSTGAQLKKALPGDAVVVSGWKELPEAGDEVLQGSEDDVKKAVQNRIRRVQLNALLQDAEAINAQRRQDRARKEEEGQQQREETSSRPQLDSKQLRLVIKADVSGSAEALSGAAEGIGNKLVSTKIITSGVGEVSESDVAMAKAVGGIVIAFNTPVSRAAEFAASQSGVEILKSRIIYEVLDSVTTRVIALLPPTIETRVTGEATVLQLFDIDVKGKSKLRVAGCRVGNGVVEKERMARVLRKGEMIHSGPLHTLRILRKDVQEVKKGLECGLSLHKFDDLQEGDLIQMYQEMEKPGQL